MTAAVGVDYLSSCYCCLCSVSGCRTPALTPLRGHSPRGLGLPLTYASLHRQYLLWLGHHIVMPHL